jgi:methylmalonyl-CoA/ethylmalonyl-CoA epimerase
VSVFSQRIAKSASSDSWLAEGDPEASAKLTGAPQAVQELRVALTVDDFDAALAFYRDTLGLPLLEAWSDDGRVVLLDAGRATLELLDATHAEAVDRIEVGRRVAGPVRLALQVEDSTATSEQLQQAGATHIAGPVVTPWLHSNVRLEAPDGMGNVLVDAFQTHTKAM